MPRAGQCCFKLLALIGSHQLLQQSYSPAVFFFFIIKLQETNRTQHVTIIFNVNQILYPNQVILLLLPVLFPAGQNSWPNWNNLKSLHSGRGFVGNKRFFICGT